MATAQVPPAVGTSGQLIDVLTINAGSTIYREVVAIGGFTSSGIAVVTTSGGLTVNVTSGVVTLSSATSLSSGIVTLSSVPTVTATAATNPWSSAPSFNIPFVSASSGLVQISGSITSTAATNPWSSAPGFNIPMVSASSGLVQISGTPTVTIVGTSGAIAPATSSGGLGVTILAGSAAGSTAINVVGTSGATAPVTSSGGLSVTIVGGAAAGSTAVNLVTSSGAFYPATSSGGLGVTILAGSGSGSTAVNLILTTTGGFAYGSTGGGLLVELTNVDALALTSGTITLSSDIGVSSGLISLSSGTFNYVTMSSTPLVNLVGTSSGVAPVTSSGGLGVTILGGAASGSTAVNIVGTTSGGFIYGSTGGGLLVEVSNPDTFAITSGTLTLSSDVAVSSGLVNLSSGAVNYVALSSASSFNLPVVNASSGKIQLSSAIALSSGIVTLSSVPTVTATAATNPWSSAPSFNVPVVSASSGEVQVVPGSTQGYTVFSYVTSSSNNSNSVVSGNMGFHGYAIFNTTGAQRHIHLYNTSSAPTVGSTANFLMTLSIPGSTAGGAGANMVSIHPLSYSTRGLGFTITDSPLTTSTGTIGQNDLAVNLFYVT